MKSVCLFAVSITFTTYAFSIELTLKDFSRAPLAKRSEYNGYVIGSASAFSWVNAHNENRGLPPLFCPPDTKALSQNFYLKLLDEAIQLARAEADSSIYETRTVSQALLIGLRRRFPCAVTGRVVFE